MTNASNILLVEDHPLTRMGIVSAVKTLAPQYQIIGELGSVASTIGFLKDNSNIQLILLDLSLTDGSGTIVAEYVKSSFPDIKILVCSMDSSKDIILHLVDIGIDGFISKMAGTDVLINAINTIMDGCSYYGADIANIINALQTAKLEADCHFSDRELEIIQLCAKGLHAKEVAAQLDISTRTVESHKTNIFKKLGFKTTSEMVRFAFEKGIVRL